MEIKRTALVMHSARDMFLLVKDVPSYPQFLSWCLSAEVHEQDHQQQLASLVVRVSGIRQQFTTRNRFVADEQLTLSLVEGPFSALAGDWRFTPIGAEGSKITLTLGFEFSNRALSGAFRRGFAHIADRLVQDFCRRADEVYR